MFLNVNAVLRSVDTTLEAKTHGKIWKNSTGFDKIIYFISSFILHVLSIMLVETLKTKLSKRRKEDKAKNIYILELLLFSSELLWKFIKCVCMKNHMDIK